MNLSQRRSTKPTCESAIRMSLPRAIERTPGQPSDDEDKAATPIDARISTLCQRLPCANPPSPSARARFGAADLLPRQGFCSGGPLCFWSAFVNDRVVVDHRIVHHKLTASAREARFPRHGWKIGNIMNSHEFQ